LLIEQSFAKKMGIKLGSILKFDMGVSPVYGKAVAFHQAHWQSMQPSFFVMFPPNSVDNFLESKMITGFVAQKDKNDVFRSIARAYPSTTFFDVDEIKNIAQQLIIPILHICIFLLTAFLITMALFSTFIQALYPMKLLPIALEKALLGSKSTYLEQFSRRLEHLILTIFIMILCKVIFTYVKWSSLGLKELDFTYISLLLCIVITYFLLSHTELKKSQEG
jgi:predicted lysophospholipase L1 biosynthesis ABC-type transport system permease subunit